MIKKNNFHIGMAELLSRSLTGVSGEEQALYNNFGSALNAGNIDAVIASAKVQYAEIYKLEGITVSDDEVKVAVIRVLERLLSEYQRILDYKQQRNETDVAHFQDLIKKIEDLLKPKTT